MPSESIAGFLDQAQANRVLFPEQIEQLIRQPDVPQTNLDAMCEYLERRGALTRFQAGMLRDGRGHELSFAGYPVLDELGPCPGGTAYRALHPSLRTPVELRRFRADALTPSDNPAALVQRARSAAAVLHPNLATILDAGVYRDEAYAALDHSPDVATLAALVHDIGPMPGFLAAEYGRQIAGALRAAHERGIWHGDIRPANLLVGPMTSKTGPDGAIKRRPAPNAAVKVAELGLVPVLPVTALSADAVGFLPPERFTAGSYDARGDLYGLGTTVYFLLTGRAPFAGGSAIDLAERVRSAEPAPLAALRPDVPPDLAAFVHLLLSKRPEQRPPTAFDAEAALARFGRPGTMPAPVAVPLAVPVAHAVAPASDVGEAHPAPAEEWGTQDAFSTAHAVGPAKRRVFTTQEKARTRLLVILGLCLHLSAVGLLVAWVTGAFESTPEPEPTPPPKKEKDPPKPKRPNRNT